jgi:glycosyltransferase involved in cell wall biosynthesis
VIAVEGITLTNIRSPRAIDRVRALVRDWARTSWHDLLDERRIAWRLDLARRCDFTDEDLERNRSQLAAAASLDGPVRTIDWYVPAFQHAAYGGIHTILRFASRWRARHGVRSRFRIHDEPDASPEAIHARIAAAFPDLADAPVTIVRDGGETQAGGECPADVGIATLWTGAYLLLRDRTVARKLYFLQDDERLFHGAGTQSALAGATWRFGFPAIVNTPGLRDVYVRESGAPAFAFVPAVDAALFHPPRAERPERPFRVFFYARPRVERNAFELGAEALVRVARRRRDVEIVAAGGDVPGGVASRFPEIRFRGLLPYSETGALYRSCHAGLALMASRHPSYLPFELMACGTVPIANVNPDNAWLLRDGVNAVVREPTVSVLAEGVERLADDRVLLRQISEEGPRTVAGARWEDQIDAALEFVRRPRSSPPRP